MTELLDEKTIKFFRSQGVECSAHYLSYPDAYVTPLLVKQESSFKLDAISRTGYFGVECAACEKKLPEPETSKCPFSFQYPLVWRECSHLTSQSCRKIPQLTYTYRKLKLPARILKRSRILKRLFYIPLHSGRCTVVRYRTPRLQE